MSLILFTLNLSSCCSLLQSLITHSSFFSHIHSLLLKHIVLYKFSFPFNHPQNCSYLCSSVLFVHFQLYLPLSSPPSLLPFTFPLPYLFSTSLTFLPTTLHLHCYPYPSAPLRPLPSPPRLCVRASERTYLMQRKRLLWLALAVEASVDGCVFAYFLHPPGVVLTHAHYVLRVSRGEPS